MFVHLTALQPARICLKPHKSQLAPFFKQYSTAPTEQEQAPRYPLAFVPITLNTHIITLGSASELDKKLPTLKVTIDRVNVSLCIKRLLFLQELRYPG
jgi:hypothetical protein